MQNLDFKLLINAFDTPTLIASQTILNQNISKYEILYANNQFFEYFPNGSKNFKYLSDFENINGYTWKELSQRAFITKNKVEEIFYSQEKECLTTISFSYLETKLHKCSSIFSAFNNSSILSWYSLSVSVLASFVAFPFLSTS